MKYFLFSVIVAILSSCNYSNQSQNATSDTSLEQNDSMVSIHLVLSGTLENRRNEFVGNVNSAIKNIQIFSEKFGWEELTREEFIDSVMIFDDKYIFNQTVLNLVEVDTSMKLPETFCAALEKRTLISVSPEFYANVYPKGIEEQSYEKLLTHEIAHRLHIRILNGDEEAMGPIWFYEGFAMYVANQFSESDIKLSTEEMIQLMKEPNRGSYVKYNYIFRYFVNMIPLQELIYNAKKEDFNEELISMIK